MSVATFCATIRDPLADEKLNAMGGLFADVRHWTFVQLHVHRCELKDVKADAIRRFGITARHFNGIRFDLDQMVAAERGVSAFLVMQREEAIRSLSQRVAREVKRVPELIEGGRDRAASSLKFSMVGRKQRLDRLKGGLAALQARADRAVPAICFGGRQGLREAQTDGETWRWHAKRAGQINLVGSKTEGFGNQSAFWRDGVLSIRLPDALGGGQVALQFVDFRQEEARGFLEASASKATRQAITWLLFRDDDLNWQVRFTVERKAAKRVGRLDAGVISVDVNVDHLAVVHVDRFGNLVSKLTLPFPRLRIDSHIADNAIGCAVGAIVALAAAKGCAVAIEKLDFSKKKAGLREYGKAHAERLSSFAYSKFQSYMRSRCDRVGVDLHEVNPAFTSVIGRAKYAGRRGLDVHHAAALVIGRRAMGYGERLVRSDGVPLDAPARMRPRIEGRRWRGVHKAPQEGGFLPVGTAGRADPSHVRPGLDPPPEGRPGLLSGRRFEAGFSKSGAPLPGRRFSPCYG